MVRYLHARLIARALLLSFMLAGSALAQVVVTPDTIMVSLAEGDEVEVVLTVFNTGADSAGFAVSLAPATSEGNPPEEPGTVLFTSENTCCQLGGLTTTPDGRLFVERDRETYEFTPELEFVREFDTPQLEFLSRIAGITYDADRGTLWWLDVLRDGGVTEQALLVEGTSDGVATGRMLSVQWNPSSRCGEPSGFPVAVTYDATATAESTGGTGYFYYLDHIHETVWAIDTLGQVVEGYPQPLSDYAGISQPFNPEGCVLGFGLDAHALGDEPVLESFGGYPFEHPNNRPTRIVVTDRMGRNRGAETPLFDLQVPDDFGTVLKLTDVVRSRLDPSVLYITSLTGFAGANARHFVYAVRAVPLPPVWLHSTPILFGVEAESETEITVTLDTSGLETGVYEAVVSVREGDGIGPVLVDVPVTLTVAPVGNEDEPIQQEALVLGEPYPNPASERVTVPLTLAESAEVRVTVYDILGREVTTLVERPVEAGNHEFALDTSDFPMGIYLVRAATGSIHLSKRLVVLK